MPRPSTYVFDTTAYSELLRGNQTVASALQSADAIFMPNVVIAELQYGFTFGAKRMDNEKLLARFLAAKKVRIALPDNATTSYFVSVAAFARKKGVQLSSHDIWIAALAEQWNATLLTFDKDFGHLNYPALKLVVVPHHVQWR